MCGRYQLQASSKELQAARPNTTWCSGHDTRHQARQQVRPTTTAPVLVAAVNSPPITSASSHDQQIMPSELVLMKWGFPSPGPSSSSRPLINARCETLLELPTFRRVLNPPDGSRRCAVPVTGFYEWHRSPPPGKQTLTPYLVRSKSQEPHQSDHSNENSIAYLAALYDNTTHDDFINQSFVIVTTASAKDFSWLHSRQPVFLSTQSHLNTWLNSGVPAEDAVAALDTESGLVSTRMLKDLSAPAPVGKEKKQKGITAFFSKRLTPQSESPSRKAPQHNEKLSVSDHVTTSQSEVSKDEDFDPTTQTLKKDPNPTKSSLKPSQSIHKKSSNPRSSPQRRKGQKAISSFFAKDCEDQH